MPAGWCRATLDATPATTADCPQVGSRKPILNHQTRQKVEPRVTTDAVLNCLHSTCRKMKKMSVNVAGNKPLPCRKTLCPAETYSRKVFSRCAEREIRYFMHFAHAPPESTAAGHARTAVGNLEMLRRIELHGTKPAD